MQSDGLGLPQCSEGSNSAADAHRGAGRDLAALRGHSHLRLGASGRLGVNQKRVRRFFRVEELQVRMCVRRRTPMWLHRGPAPKPDLLISALEHGKLGCYLTRHSAAGPFHRMRPATVGSKGAVLEGPVSSNARLASTARAVILQRVLGRD